MIEVSLVTWDTYENPKRGELRALDTKVMDHRHHRKLTVQLWFHGYSLSEPADRPSHQGRIGSRNSSNVEQLQGTSVVPDSEITT